MNKFYKDCFFTDNNGFTLIELIIVVAIISILAAISVTAYLSYIDRGKLTLTINTLDSARKTLEVNRLDSGNSYPANIDFTECKDNLGSIVFQKILCDKIKKDCFEIVSYVVGIDTYVLTARANDNKKTLIVITPNETQAGN